MRLLEDVTDGLQDCAVAQVIAVGNPLSFAKMEIVEYFLLMFERSP